MVDFPDLWVPQYELPSIYVLIYFVFIDFIFFLSTVLVSYQSYSRINDSMKVGEKSVQENRSILYFAILFTDLGLIIFPINNLISHLSGIYTIYAGLEPAYLFIGFTSILHPIGFILFMVGLIMLFRSLVTFNPFKINLFEFIAPMILQAIIFFIILIPPIYFINYEFDIITSLTQYFIFVLVVLLLIIIIYLYWILNNVNQIVRLRIILLITMLLVFLLLIIIISFYLPSDTQIAENPDSVLTRNSAVEFLIFSLNTFALLETALLYLFISLPIPLRELFGVARRDFYQNMEDGLDLESFHPWIHKTNFTQGTILPDEVNRDTNYVVIECFSHKDRSSDDLLSTIQEVFHTNKVMGSNILSEDYFRKFELKRSDIFIVGNMIDEEIRHIFDVIKDNYQNTTFDFEDEVLKIDKFEYKFEGYRFALLISISSILSEGRKLWILLTPTPLTEALNSFLHNYAQYFDTLSNNTDIFSVLRFPIEDNEVIEISPSSDDLNIPDPNYVTYLGVTKR